MIMRNRNWRLYSDILDQILKISRDILFGGVRRSDYLMKARAITDPKMSGLIADIGEMSSTPSMEGVKLTFVCDTFSKWPRYYHIVKVIDIENRRSIPIVKRGWLLNREVPVFAKIINAFIQGLYNYAFKQWSTESLGKRFGVPVKLVPRTFGWTLEDWEKEFSIPSLGTDDVVGSYMRHVYDGTLELTDKTLFDR
jgi:hypothetical protein